MGCFSSTCLSSAWTLGGTAASAAAAGAAPCAAMAKQRCELLTSFRCSRYECTSKRLCILFDPFFALRSARFITRSDRPWATNPMAASIDQGSSIHLQSSCAKSARQNVVCCCSGRPMSASKLAVRQRPKPARGRAAAGAAAALVLAHAHHLGHGCDGVAVVPAAAGGRQGHAHVRLSSGQAPRDLPACGGAHHSHPPQHDTHTHMVPLRPAAFIFFIMRSRDSFSGSMRSNAGPGARPCGACRTAQGMLRRSPENGRAGSAPSPPQAMRVGRRRSPSMHMGNPSPATCWAPTEQR